MGFHLGACLLKSVENFLKYLTLGIFSGTVVQKCFFRKKTKTLYCSLISASISFILANPKAGTIATCSITSLLKKFKKCTYLLLLFLLQHEPKYMYI